MSTKVSNPYSTGAGGANFEVKVLAQYLLYLLIGGHVPCMRSGRILSAEMQAKKSGYQTDDLVLTVQVSEEIQQRMLIQIRHGAAVSEKDFDFKEALRDAWADFNNRACFTPSLDVIALVTGPHSEQVSSHLRPLLDWARTSSTAAEFFSKVKLSQYSSNQKRKYLEIFKTLFSEFCGKQVDEPLLWNFLRSYYVLPFDFDCQGSKDESTVLNLIKRARSSSTELDDIAVWHGLISQAQAWNETGGTHVPTHFPQRLTNSVCNDRSLSAGRPPHHEQNISNLPLVSSSYYVSRPAIEEKIGQTLKESGGRVALVGLGGTGKSALALHFAEKHSTTFEIIWWIDAATKESGIASFSELYEKLCGDKVKITDPVRRAYAVREQLTRSDRWLLVLDGTDETALAFIRQFVPNGSGTVILTSIMPNVWWEVAAEVEVRAFEPAEAIDFITRRSRATVQDEVASLAERLGNLPLALELAVAFILSNRCTVTSFLTELENRSLALLDSGKPAVDHERTLTAVFQMAYAKTVERSGAAAQLLLVCSFLAGSRIPLSMLLRAQDAMPSDLRENLADGSKRLTLRGDVTAYSLIALQEENFSMHRLVQEFLRRELTQAPDFASAMRAAFVSTNVALPDLTFENRVLINEALPHAFSLLPYCHEAPAYEAARLLNQLGVAVARTGAFATAHPMLSLGVKRATEKGSAEDLCISLMSNLAWVESELGNLDKAFELASVCSEWYSRHKTGDASEAVALNNLAKILAKGSDKEKAWALYRRAIQIATKNGSAGIDALTCAKLNMAEILVEQGASDEAETLCHEAFTIRREHYGLHHWETILAALEWAIALESAGHNLEAKSLANDVLELAVTSCGNQDSLTERCYVVLAKILYTCAEPIKARQLIEHARSVYRDLRGDEWTGWSSFNDIESHISKMVEEAERHVFLSYSKIETHLSQGKDPDSASNEIFEIIAFSRWLPPQDAFKWLMSLATLLEDRQTVSANIFIEIAVGINYLTCKLDDFTPAQQMVEKIYQQAAGSLSHEPGLRATFFTARACLATKLREYQKANDLWAQAAEIWKACAPGEVDWSEAEMMAGRMALELGDRDLANEHFRNVVDSTSTSNPDRELAERLLSMMV